MFGPEHPFQHYRKGLTKSEQQLLSAKLGISYDTFRQIALSKRRNPSQKLARKIAEETPIKYSVFHKE